MEMVYLFHYQGGKTGKIMRNFIKLFRKMMENWLFKKGKLPCFTA
jgi:hypothetical protein